MMRPITADVLRVLGGSRAKESIVTAIAAILDASLQQAEIYTPLRAAHFLAHATYETWYFSMLEEDLDYSAQRIATVFPRLGRRASELAGKPEPLANAVYAYHNGNGSEDSGDGWRFRGRGLFDLTGRANYRAAGAEDDPDSVALPAGAVASAIMFWNLHKASSYADKDDIEMTTRLINGATTGLHPRSVLKDDAIDLLRP